MVLNTPPAAATSSPMRTTRSSLHLLGDASGDRVAVGQFRHAEPPSAHRSVTRVSPGSGGERLAPASVASSTSACGCARCRRAFGVDAERFEACPVEVDGIAPARQPPLRRDGTCRGRPGSGPCGGRSGPRPARGRRRARARSMAGEATGRPASASLPSTMMRSSP